jgi:hypothetical protein
MKLWIGNIAPDTGDAELRDLVKKYAPDLECTDIQRVDGDGSRPAAVLMFPAAPIGALESVSMRLNGMYWKERSLVVQTLIR